MTDLGPMHSPPHPGRLIVEVYLAELNISARQLAHALDVSPSTLTRVINGASGISAEMALRLSRALGGSPGSWLNMQNDHDLWVAAQRADLGRVTSLRSDVA